MQAAECRLGGEARGCEAQPPRTGEQSQDEVRRRPHRRARRRPDADTEWSPARRGLGCREGAGPGGGELRRSVFNSASSQSSVDFHLKIDL